MGGKNEIMCHVVTSFLLFSVIKFHLSESGSLLIHELPAAWHSEPRGFSDTWVRSSAVPPLPWPVAFPSSGQILSWPTEPRMH